MPLREFQPAGVSVQLGEFVHGLCYFLAVITIIFESGYYGRIAGCGCFKPAQAGLARGHGQHDFGTVIRVIAPFQQRFEHRERGAMFALAAKAFTHHESRLVPQRLRPGLRDDPLEKVPRSVEAIQFEAGPRDVVQRLRLAAVAGMRRKEGFETRDGLLVPSVAEGDLSSEHVGVGRPVAAGVFPYETVEQSIGLNGVARVEVAPAQRKKAVRDQLAVGEQPEHLLIPFDGLRVLSPYRPDVADQDQRVVDQGASGMIPQDKACVFDRAFVGGDGHGGYSAVRGLLVETYTLPFLERLPGVVKGIVVRAPEKHAYGSEQDQRGFAHVSHRTCTRPPGRS